MPYVSNEDLPPSVPQHLPDRAQDIDREAFNHALDHHGREGTAHRVAWAAVSRSHEKVEGRWVARVIPSMPRAAAGRMLGLLLIIMAFTAAACAPAANPLEDTAAAFRCCTAWGETSAGFWLGLWHGAIAPVTFVVSLFSSDVGIYEVHNNGGWYHAGFLFGLTMSIGGGAGGRSYYRTGWRRGSRKGA